MVLIIWFAAIVSTWWVLLAIMLEPLPVCPRPTKPPDVKASLRRQLRNGLLLVVPPTVLWAVCNFVLLQAAPTVQFNVGSRYAMRLWSFWVHAWEPLCSVSLMLFVIYAFSSLALAYCGYKRLLWVSLAALFTSGVAWFAVRLLGPTA